MNESEKALFNFILDKSEELAVCDELNRRYTPKSASVEVKQPKIVGKSINKSKRDKQFWDL